MSSAAKRSIINYVNVDYLAAYPTIPIFFDNAPFDGNTPPQAYVEFEIKFAGGNQVGMSQDPLTRTNGFIYVTAWQREGVSANDALLMLDWFESKLGYKSTGLVEIKVPEYVGGTAPAGWYMEQLKLYFHTKPA